MQLTQTEHERRWRLAVTAGLLVGPFFPASNVLFYVGTFIGERLLYFPSGALLWIAMDVALAFWSPTECQFNGPVALQSATVSCLPSPLRHCFNC